MVNIFFFDRFNFQKSAKSLLPGMSHALQQCVKLTQPPTAVHCAGKITSKEQQLEVESMIFVCLGAAVIRSRKLGAVGIRPYHQGAGQAQ